MFSSYRPILIDINEIPNTWNLYYTYIITFIDVLASTRNSSITQLDKDGVRIAFLLLSPSWRFSRHPSNPDSFAGSTNYYSILKKILPKYSPSKEKKKKQSINENIDYSHTAAIEQRAREIAIHPSIHPSVRPSVHKRGRVHRRNMKQREREKKDQRN